MGESLIRTVFVLPSLMRAGAETQVVNLVNGLDSACFEKHLFVFEQQLDQLDRVDRDRVCFHHHLRRHKYDIRPAIQLARLIDERHIDIVYCTLQIALFVGWLAIRLAKHKPRFVLNLQTTVNRNLKDELFDRFFYQWLMRSCNPVICACQAQENHWQAKFSFLRGRTVVIYNGVDTEWFDPDKGAVRGERLREQHHIPEDAFVACCIAAFRPEKGHRYLLQAFKQVVSAHPNAFLLLAGDGPLRVKMELFAKETGLSKQVLFLGVLNDVRPVLAASDISIIASTAVETFSLAMLESLAMGVPMVMTDIGGAREAIRPGNTGVLVRAGDTQSLANGILEMAKDTSQRMMMGAQARRFVCDNFARERMIRETAQILHDEVPDEGAALGYGNSA